MVGVVQATSSPFRALLRCRAGRMATTQNFRCDVVAGSSVGAMTGDHSDSPAAPDKVDVATVVSAAFRQAWDSSPAQITVTQGPRHVLVYQNRASQTLFGARPLGVPVVEAFPEASGSAGRLSHVLATGETLDVPARQVPVLDPVGAPIMMRYVLAPWGDPPEGVVLTALDVTAETRAEQALARTRLLADITGRMTSARDAAAALQALADGLVPEVADLAALYVVDVGQDPADPSTPPLPPDVVALSPELAALGPLPPPTRRDEPAPWDEVLLAGNSLIIPVDEQTLPVLAPDPAANAWLRAAHANSMAVVPLVVAGVLTGAMILVGAGDRAPFADADLPFLEDVTARAGSAISQVRTVRQQRDIAAGLQRALLPAVPSDLPGFTCAARYIAGAPQVEVGGDWWDVHRPGDGQIGVGIGDVSGRGIAAAAVMGQASAAMRAAGHARLSPAGVLSLLDALLADVITGWEPSQDAPQFATAAYVLVDPTQHSLRAANAGHLPLLIRAADGRVRVVGLPIGPPLGLGSAEFAEIDIPFGPGETLVMYTDGLVESKEQDLDDGITALARALDRHGGNPDLEQVADLILAAMGREHGHGADDVALVLLRGCTRPD